MYNGRILSFLQLYDAKFSGPRCNESVEKEYVYWMKMKLLKSFIVGVAFSALTSYGMCGIWLGIGEGANLIISKLKSND